MSIEIKFRAWDTREGLFAGVRISDNGKISALEYDHLEEVWYYKEDNDNRYILEQYTGLKDKNGKEIYEGDIVREYDDGLSNVGKVEWDEYNAGFCVVWSMYDTDTLEEGKLTVIGNIHENPELIGGEDA